ncbi:MAG: aldo/keto reductase [Eubacterium sp.]
MNTKKLGFGLMRLPVLDENDPSRIDIEQAKKMVDLFMEKGFTYFDTAWMYHNFQSEHATKEILVDRYPRESYTLATKLHSGFFDSMEDRDNIFLAQLEKQGLHILILISCMELKKRPLRNMRNWIVSIG